MRRQGPGDTMYRKDAEKYISGEQVEGKRRDGEEGDGEVGWLNGETSGVTKEGWRKNLRWTAMI